MSKNQISNNLLGRKVRFTAPGRYHQREDLPPPGVECEIVAVFIEEGELNVSILSPEWTKGGEVQRATCTQWSMRWVGQAFNMESAPCSPQS